MKVLPLLLLLSLATVCAQTDYPPPPEATPRDGVPRGELIKFDFDHSRIFPGTTRAVTVYVPRQYDGTKPACLYVNQDGLQWKADVVFDNLLAKGEIPVLIGVFVMHGRVKAADETKALDRFNRSLEYDGLGPDYARFLIEELLPEVEKKSTADGRKILLSKAAADRAIGGSSSGAICAFTAAWERPDSFSRVFSNVGTFVSLRGGDRYPGLIRKYEPKALRVFQVDGSNDNNIYAGDWWMANQMMDRALTFAGYDHWSVWGDGGHNAKHGTHVFPDAMRYLWRGWPESVKAGTSQNRMLNEILIPGEDWVQVWEGGKFTEGPAANANGEVFFNDIPNSKTYRVGLDGKVTEFVGDSKRANGMAFGPDGRLFVAATGGEKILSYDASGTATEVASGLRANDLVALHNGNLYATEPSSDPKQPSKIWLVKPDGTKRVVDTGLKFSNGIAASPDQTLLYVADSRTHWVYSYQIQRDGSLRHKQRYYWLHEPDTADDSGADGIDVDADGRLYVTTRLGVQVCDQAGRVNVILPTPNGRASNVAIGEAGQDTLFVTAGDQVFKRKLKVRAAQSYHAPIKPKAPGL
jgi:sugar lactone lactonase YvrE/enterochelin esterase-like enzyme